TVPYNDPASVKEAFRQYGDDIAAVIVEPVSGNMGVVPPVESFLQDLRDITADNGSLLIFDEVLTGFRVAYHCAQGYFSVKSDLTCLCKVIGGVLPVGLYGGKREIIESVVAAGSIYQAGTLSGHPLAMTAGYETLSALEPATYDVISEKVDKLIAGYEAAAAAHNIPIQVNRAGSTAGFFLVNKKDTKFETASTSNLEMFKNYYQGMIKEGIFLPPSQFEGLFLSTAHSDEDIEQTI